MKKKKRNITIARYLVSLAVAAGVFVFSGTYAPRILPGVRIGSISVGSLTHSQAVQRLEQTLSTQRIRLTYGSLAWQPRVSELGVEYDIQTAVDEAFRVGRTSGPGRVWTALALRQPLRLIFSWDDDKLRSYLATLAEDVGLPPRNAAVENINGMFTIIPEQNGVVIEPGRFQRDAAAVLATASSASVALQPTIHAPHVATTDLTEALAKAEQLVSTPLTMKVKDKEFSIASEKLVDWVEFTTLEGSHALASLAPPQNLGPKVTLDLKDEDVRSYLESLAPQVNTAPEEQRVLKSKNKVEILKTGKVGSMLALEVAAPRLKEYALNRAGGPLELPTVEVPSPTAYEPIPPAPVPQGKVITVDLTKLHEYLYENGELVYSAKISPGINDWTPTGTFKIYAKTKKQKMSGPGYYLPNVPNILWFKGDYSLHGVYWHNDFGIRPRSHGCVGQSLEDAEWAFNWAEVGTPVVIYKS